MFNAGQRVNFMFDRRRHERCEPPRHHFRPESRVNDVESF